MKGWLNGSLCFRAKSPLGSHLGSLVSWLLVQTLGIGYQESGSVNLHKLLGACQPHHGVSTPRPRYQLQWPPITNTIITKGGRQNLTYRELDWSGETGFKRGSETGRVNHGQTGSKTTLEREYGAQSGPELVKVWLLYTALIGKRASCMADEWVWRSGGRPAAVTGKCCIRDSE